jgi:hypothetical protein
MPALRKPQAQKDLTRRLREERKHRKACRHVLGPIGTRLFREFLNLHGRLPIATTALWAEALTRVFAPKQEALQGTAKERMKSVRRDYRAQVAGWSQALLLRHHDSLTPTELIFRVRILELKGDLQHPWHGLLMVLYEHRHGVVFHALKEINAGKPLNGEFVWTAVNQAIRRLSSGRWPHFKLNSDTPPEVTVALPVGYGKRFVHTMLEQAFSCKDGCAPDTWRIEIYPGLKSAALKLEDLTYLEFDRWLRHQSRKISTALRSLNTRTRRGNGENDSSAREHDRPAWLLLFPDEYPYDFRRYA